MLYKNIEIERRKNRKLWSPYYERVTENKRAYSRKEKHKVNYRLMTFD